MVRADLGVSTVAWDGHDWEVCFACLAELGITKVELAYIAGYVDFTEDDFSTANATRLRRAIAAHGLRPGAISGHTDMGTADAIEKLARRLTFAAEMGSQLLVTNATESKFDLAFRRALDATLPIAESAGVVLALENPGHGNDTLLASGVDGAALVSSMDSPWLRLNYDPANAVTYSRGTVDLAADAAAALPWAVQVHAKDFSTRSVDWRFTALGEGEFDVVGFAGLLVTREVPPAVTLELPLRLFRPNGGDPSRLPQGIETPKIKSAVRSSIEAWSEAVTIASQGAQSGR